MREAKEPRQTYSKKDCICSKCKGKVKKGDPIHFDPVKKEVTCSRCIEKETKNNNQNKEEYEK